MTRAVCAAFYHAVLRSYEFRRLGTIGALKSRNWPVGRCTPMSHLRTSLLEGVSQSQCCVAGGRVRASRHKISRPWGDKDMFSEYESEDHEKQAMAILVELGKFFRCLGCDGLAEDS
jgi:hypothetical protein